MIGAGPEPPPATHASAPEEPEPRLRWPSWPGWLLLLAGFVGLSAAASSLGAAPVADGAMTAALLVGGPAVMLAGFTYFAVRSLRARAALPASRYRGPSVLLLFLIVLFAEYAVGLPLLSILLGGGAALDDPGILFFLLALTPTGFAAVAIVLVAWPGALRGVRWTDGAASIVSLAKGLAWAVPVWLLAGIVAYGVSEAYQALTGRPPPEGQAVIDLLSGLPMPLIVVAVVVLAPIGEELFFRGVAFNAWLREHGMRVALVGSTLFFAVLHVVEPVLAWAQGEVAALGSVLVTGSAISVVGLALGVAYARSRSLPLVIGLHAGFNGITVMGIYLAPQLAS